MIIQQKHVMKFVQRKNMLFKVVNIIVLKIVVHFKDMKILMKNNIVVLKIVMK